MKETFEKNLEKLEQIVEVLEAGSISLDESLKGFEQGVKLSRSCHKELSEAQKKVEILIQDEEGNESKQPFEG